MRPGGQVAAYAWDFPGGGFPLQALHEGMRAFGVEPLLPPSPDASRTEVMRALWTGAGLEAVETRAITVQRTFADFEDVWTTSLLSGNVGPRIAAMSASDRQLLKERLRARLTPDASGRVTCTARANAVKGRVGV